MERKRQIWNEAKRLVKDNNRVREVVESAAKKLKKATANSQHFQEASSKIGVLIRMIKAHLSKQYVAFSNRTILMVVFALLYFVIPTDVIPDFIPALGFTDDISLIYFIWKQIDEDISAFLHWEEVD